MREAIDWVKGDEAHDEESLFKILGAMSVEERNNHILQMKQNYQIGLEAAQVAKAQLATAKSENTANSFVMVPSMVLTYVGLVSLGGPGSGPVVGGEGPAWAKYVAAYQKTLPPEPKPSPLMKGGTALAAVLSFVTLWLANTDNDAITFSDASIGRLESEIYEADSLIMQHKIVVGHLEQYFNAVDAATAHE